jgi:O-antigen/teichoic acid export membrane protein
LKIFARNLIPGITNFLRKPFVRNVTIVASGTAAAQVITMIFSPLITRIYGPEAFGLFGIFQSLVAILTPIAALAYPIAIVLPKEDAEAKGLVKLSFMVSAAVFCAVAIILLTGGEKLLAMLDSEAIAPYVMLIPLSMVFAAFMEIGQQWLIRKKQFAITARVAVLQAFLLNLAKTIIGWINPVGAVLVILATLGNGLHAAMLWLGIKKTRTFAGNLPPQQTSPLSLKDLVMQYNDFPLFRAPQIFINAISQSLPTLMLASFFGPSSAGFYTICRTVLGMPSRLIGKAVGDVFYPRITEASHRGEDLSKLILKATLALVAVGFLPFFIILAFGPQLFAFVFGGEWRVAGEYARWISVWVFFQFINKPSVMAIPVLKLQRSLLIYELFSTASKVLALYIGFSIFSSDIIAIALFSMFGVFAYAFLIIWVIVNSKNKLE